MQHRIYKTNALIVRRSNIGEADRLLVISTPAGKRRVVAKGVRKTTSRLAGHIELFAHTIMMLAVGRNLDVITQSHVIDSFASMRASLSHLSCAYYVAELYDALTQEEENPHLFSLLLQTLKALDTTNNVDLVLRAYELRLLDTIGYRPQLQRCAVCQEMLTEEAERFSPLLGGVICPRDVHADRLALPMSLGAFKVIRYIQRQPLNTVVTMNISTQVRTEVEHLLRAYLVYILERDLRSAAFLDSLRVDRGNLLTDFQHTSLPTTE